MYFAKHEGDPHISILGLDEHVDYITGCSTTINVHNSVKPFSFHVHVGTCVCFHVQVYSCILCFYGWYASVYGMSPCMVIYHIWHVSMYGNLPCMVGFTTSCSIV